MDAVCVTEKAELRAQMRAARREHFAGLSDGIRALLFLRPPSPIVDMIPQDAVVGLYHARGSEAPTRRYAQWLMESGRRIALPYFATRDSEMEFREWRDPYEDSDVEVSTFGLKQPVSDAAVVEPELVFAPLVAFTPACERLGQGGGFYDRWLAAYPDVPVIGMAWDAQLVDSLPLEPHDRMMDGVVTPTRFFERTSHA